MHSVDEILASVKDYLSPETLRTRVVKVCVLDEDDYSAFIQIWPAYANKDQYYLSIDRSRMDEAIMRGIIQVNGKRLAIASYTPEGFGGIRVRCELYE